MDLLEINKVEMENKMEITKKPKIKSGRFSLPDLIHIDVGFPSIIIARSPL